MMFKGLLSSVFFALCLIGNAAGCGGAVSGGVGGPLSGAVSGVVRDMAGLDGCGMAMVLPDGGKLHPVEIVPDFELKDGQKVWFTYRPADAMTACMAGKTVVLTAIEEVE